MKRQILDKRKWLKKRETLKNSYEINKTWNQVIDLFNNRITDFYFNPIEDIIKTKKLKGEGFTILTIQCALIEMFASFKSGKIHNYRKNPKGPKYEYKKSDECFISFLQSEEMFKDHFFQEDGTKDVPFKASDFYDKVRCGLMHEARTKGEWVVNSKREYLGNEKIFITKKGSSEIRIDRTILNYQLKKYFEGYLDSLRQNSDAGNQLRRLFARKLDHMHDIKPDNYDWWKDK